MGFPNNNHIKTFVKGQTIEDIAEDNDGFITLRFKSGESLRLAPIIKRQQADIETIATPYRSDGEVKQTTEIGIPFSDNAEVSDGGPLTHESSAAQSRRSLH